MSDLEIESASIDFFCRKPPETRLIFPTEAASYGGREGTWEGEKMFGERLRSIKEPMATDGIPNKLYCFFANNLAL